jgi:hypothetical protein
VVVDGGDATESTSGISSWGDIGAFSVSDPLAIYFFGDNGASEQSTNAGDSFTSLGSLDFNAGGLWTAGAAEVDPLDSNKAWASMATSSGGTPPTVMGLFDLSSGTVNDISTQVESALGGQGPGGFEVYATSSGYRLRVVGLQGAVAVSDDEGASFQTVSSSAPLAACGNWAGRVRQLTSYAGDHSVVATWCPKTNDVAISLNGGVSWGQVSNAPAWQNSGCSNITGVVLTATQAVVACGSGHSVAFPF